MSSPTGTINESIQSEKKESTAGVADDEPLLCKQEQESDPEEETKEECNGDDLERKEWHHDAGDTLEGSEGEGNGGGETEKLQEDTPTGQHILYPG